VDLIMARLKGVIAVLLSDVRSAPLRWFLQAGQPFIRHLARAPLRERLVNGLGDSYQP
jgi:hypothetical protein